MTVRLRARVSGQFLYLSAQMSFFFRIFASGYHEITIVHAILFTTRNIFVLI